MQKYLKDYAVYLEDHNRETISQLKELEQRFGADLNDPGSAAYQTFLTAGIKRERERSDFIMAEMDQARQMDLLVERTKRPAVNCRVCGMLMREDGYTFRNDNRESLFSFSARKDILPNGSSTRMAKGRSLFRSSDARSAGAGSIL